MAVHEQLTNRLATVAGTAGRLTPHCRYLFASPGKRIRPLMAAAAADLRVGPLAPHSRGTLTSMVDLVHEASLQHDDFADGSAERRGRPTVATVFGAADAQGLAVFLLGTAIEHAALLQQHTGNPLPLSALCHLAMGQLTEAIRPATSSESAKRNYQAVVHLKTSALFVFALHSGHALNPCDEPTQRALTAYGTELGFAFQLLDDTRDVEGTASGGRRAGVDLETGVMTWPTILWAQQFGWHDALTQLRDRDPRVLQALQATDVVAQTRLEAAGALERAGNAAESLPESVGRAYLQHLLTSVSP